MSLIIFYPMFSKKFVLAGALSCAAASATAFASMPAQAACLTTTGGIAPAIDNNCVTYNNVGGTTTATLHYKDSKLMSNGNWQLAGSDQTFSNYSGWSYSQDGTNYTPFAPALTNINGFTRTDVFTTPNPVGNPFFLRVALSPTATLNVPFDFTLYSNSNGATDGDGILRNTGGTNGYTALTRTFTRQMDPPPPPAPGPLPLMGAAFAFGYSRKIRKAIRTKV